MNNIRSISVFLSVVFVFIFISTQNVFAQAKQQLIKDINIKVEAVETPYWTVANVPQKGGITSRKWLQIDIDFTTGASSKVNESLDNLVAEFEMLLPAEDGKGAMALLSGKVGYWAVALDGQVHHIVAFVPPRIVEKITGSSKKITTGDAKKIEVKVVFKYNEAEIATGYQIPKSGTAAQVATRFENAKKVINLIRQKDAIFGQDKTPWAFLNYDYYEQVNPDAK